MSFVRLFALSQGLHVCALDDFLPRRNGYITILAPSTGSLPFIVHNLPPVSNEKCEIESVVSRLV